jgi:hypothetical protein
MIGCLAVMATALVIFGGCDGANDGSRQSEPTTKVSSPLAGRLSAWSRAATSYNAVLQECRQPYPARGYVAACTREWRVNHRRATSRLRRALRSERPSSGTCREAFLQVRPLVLQATNALRQAFEAYSAFLDALLDDGPNRGSRVRPRGLLERADRITKRNTRLADDLSAEIRKRC